MQASFTIVKLTREAHVENIWLAVIIDIFVCKCVAECVGAAMRRIPRDDIPAPEDSIVLGISHHPRRAEVVCFDWIRLVLFDHTNRQNVDISHFSVLSRLSRRSDGMEDTLEWQPQNQAVTGLLRCARNDEFWENTVAP